MVPAVPEVPKRKMDAPGENPKSVSVAKPAVGSAATVGTGVALAWLIAKYLKGVYHYDPDANDMLYLVALTNFFCNWLSSFASVLGSVARVWLKRQGLIENNGGFTLIELMVVITIMGILAAVAVPRFMSFRKRAFDAAAKSDLRQLINRQENFMAASGKYAASVDELKAEAPLQLSPDIEISVSGSDNDYEVAARSTKCAPGTGAWSFSSVTGKVEGRQCE